jgi:Fur family ferric uptake transcriptional regulator
VRYHAEASGHHHHLVCRGCGTVIDIKESTLSSLRDILLHDYNFQAELKHVGIFGLCQKCRKKSAGSKK